MSRSKQPRQISRYEVLNRLGEGGMGVVYLARDPLLERTVAIKVLSVPNDELRERFFREARSVARLKHHNIVTIYDIGEHDDGPFLAMEYIDGETLAEIIKRRAAMSLRRKLQLILELCAGLGYAHQNEIIHRDIKPANLMVTAEGVLKVLDFGLARVTSEASNTGLTRAGMVIGTPNYMSPEQVEGSSVDRRSDIFAVGLVLYELLGGAKAFAGEGVHVVLHKIVSGTPRPLRELCADLDPALEAIVNRAIEKTPSQRYPNLSLLAIDLERVLDRLQDDEATVFIERSAAPTGAEPTGPPVHQQTPVATPKNFPNFEAISKRRLAQIQSFLDAGAARFDQGDYDGAIEQCEQAAILDPQASAVLELLTRAHRGIEERRVAGWLEEARQEIERGGLTRAEKLVRDALQLRPDSPPAIEVQRDVRTRRRELERAAERARVVEQALDRARSQLKDGAYSAAARSASEALAHDPANEEARLLQQQALEGVEQRQRQEEEDQRALARIADARRMVARGELDSAIAALQAYTPPHHAVTAVLADFEAQRRVREERRQKEEAERRRREVDQRAEQDRKDAEARAREEDDRRLQAAAEAERQRQLQVDEARRLEAERQAEQREAALRREQETRRHAVELQQRAAEEQRTRAAADLQARRETARAKRDEARQLVERGDFKAALSALQAARAATPSDSDIERAIADVSRQWKDARAEADRHALRDRHVDKAGRCLAKGDVEGARASAAAALALDPSGDTTEGLLARIDAEAGRREAQFALDRAQTPTLVVPGARRTSKRAWIAAAALAIAAAAAGTSRLVRARPVAVPPETMLVSIDVRPWAHVRVVSIADGKQVGEDGITPLLIEMAPGDYRVECWTDSRAKLHHETIHVRPGDANQVRISMPDFDPNRIVDEILGGRRSAPGTD